MVEECWISMEVLGSIEAVLEACQKAVLVERDRRAQEIVAAHRHDQGKGTVSTAKNGGQASLGALSC